MHHERLLKRRIRNLYRKRGVGPINEQVPCPPKDNYQLSHNTLPAISDLGRFIGIPTSILYKLEQDRVRMRSGSLIVIVCLTSLTSFTVTSSFYPLYMPILTNLSQNVCNETLALMQGVTYTPDSAPSPPSAADFCYGHENCMLANVPAAYLSNYQAASVIMGLTPTLLASLGPSVAETSLLSAHRPLLSFLISLGAPVVYPMRVFDFTDPFSLLQHKQHMFKPPLFGGEVISIVQYIGVCIFSQSGEGINCQSL